MKLFLISVCVLCRTCLTARIRGGIAGSGAEAGAGAKGAGAGNRSSGSAALAVQELVRQMLVGEGGVQLVNIVGEASKYVDFDKAAQALAQNHPSKELSAVLRARTLVNASLGAKSAQLLPEKSLEKARLFLHGLVETAQRELDAKIIEAKEFEARNRGTHGAVVADISRLGGQIADQMGLSAQATAGIADMNGQITDVKRQRQDEKDAYDREYNANFADMTVKQNDLDVFDFLIRATKQICDKQGGASLLHVSHHVPLKLGLPGVQVCGSSDGDASLRFSDATLQAKFDKLLVKGSRDLLNNALSGVRSRSLQLLQAEKAAQPNVKVKVADGQNEELGDVKCGPIPDCGLLYDTLSLTWGGYKDQVDELKKEMDQNDAAWKTLKEDFDAQITSLTGVVEKFVNSLSEATAAKNADQHVLAEKEAERLSLDDEHKKSMQNFRDRIKYIVMQEIWGPTAVRNAIMKQSKDCETATIDDCDVTPWTPSSCSVACDDRCPSTKIACGGTQTLTRTIVVTPNKCGINCPDLTAIRKCNQIKCPVNCLMSQWSGWSKCSKDCEGGVQQRTRSVLVKAQQGGQGCAAVSDGRPCNTGSCDRDCTLEEWTAWSPCSMACGGGDQQRVRKVIVPIRGGGKCPKPQSEHRFQRHECNAHVCVGDELCVAKQDLVVAVDGSGSVHVDGFKLVRNFTGELLKRYRSRYWGDAAMQVGIVLFGNGAIEEDGTIAKAELVHELSDDLPAEREAAEKMEHQKGFTNLAQAYALAEKLLQQKGRKEAQSAVMTISDGKPSFLFETREKNMAMKDAGISFFNIGIAEFPGSDAWQLMLEMASQPADTNTVRVPGIDALEDGGGPFVQKAITKFCPNSLSPSMTLENERRSGFMLVRKGGYCGGELGRCLKGVYDPHECFARAAEDRAAAFAVGHGFRNGDCCIEHKEVTCESYKQWQESQEDPECAKFESSKFYNWYAMEPNCEK